MRTPSILSLLIMVLTLSFTACPQNTLCSRIEKIIAGKNLTLGLTVENLQTASRQPSTMWD